MPKILEVVAEAVQFTPGREPVKVQYSARGTAEGPLKGSLMFHTTQTELFEHSVGRKAIDGDEITWGDLDVVAMLQKHLDDNGINATVTVLEPDAPPTPEAKAAAANLKVTPAKD